MKNKLQLLVSSAILLPLICFSQINRDSEYRNYAPVISRDGKSIAYYAKIEGNWDVYTMDIKEKKRTRLTTHTSFDGQPSFSPDGRKIVFTSSRDGNNGIYVIDLQSMKIDQIIKDTIPVNNPIFSFDGASIVYRSKVGSQWFLFSFDLNSDQSQIFSNVPVEGRIRWSTEGKSLNFITEYQNRYAICRLDGNGQPISMTFTKFDYLGNPHYSDLKSKFIFDAHQDGSDTSGDGKWELWTIEPDGANLNQITNDEFDDWGAYWSYDSKAIVYSGNGLKGNGYEIFHLTLNQKDAHRLTFQSEN